MSNLQKAIALLFYTVLIFAAAKATLSPKRTNVAGSMS